MNHDIHFLWHWVKMKVLSRWLMGKPMAYVEELDCFYRDYQEAKEYFSHYDVHLPPRDLVDIWRRKHERKSD